MAQNYFDDELETRRKNRIKKKKKKKAKKIFVTVIALIAAAVAAFAITIKIAEPDFDFSSLFRENTAKVSAYVKNIGEKDTSAPTTKKKTTTTKYYYNYADSSEFKFDSSKKGNFVGNLLNGGLVAKSPSYFYNIKKGKGIYRFVNSTEDYGISYKTGDNIGCMNLVGDYIYFVDKDDNRLYQLKRGTSDTKVIADNVEFAYVYDSDIYVFGDGGIRYISADGTETELYRSSGKLTFVGVSLDRVFFTDFSDGKVQYLSADKTKKGVTAPFFDDTDEDDIKCLTLENGFFYYYKQKDNGKYKLVRQKFGSKDTVTLVKKAKPIAYPVVDANKVYYAVFSDGKYEMREYNMNSDTKRTLIYADGVDNSDDVCFYHGGEYDFIIGKRVYIAGSMYSSSTNTMKFSDGKWKY